MKIEEQSSRRHRLARSGEGGGQESRACSVTDFLWNNFRDYMNPWGANPNFEEGDRGNPDRQIETEGGDRMGEESLSF